MFVQILSQLGPIETKTQLVKQLLQNFWLLERKKTRKNFKRPDKLKELTKKQKSIPTNSSLSCTKKSLTYSGKLCLKKSFSNNFPDYYMFQNVSKTLMYF